MANQWNPPVELSPAEEEIMKRVKKRPLFAFFRTYRHRLFDEATQGKLLAAYHQVERGKDALPPAQMALAMLMQAAFGVPDHDVPELTVVDMRWQMVLDCADARKPVISQGSVYNFRLRCIEHGLVQVLINRAVELARETKCYSATGLRAALDSSPLWGAGRVEDTFNLIGRAAAQVVKAAAEEQGRTVAEVAVAAGIPLVTASSIKAGLDLDWNDPKAKAEGLRTLLGQVESLQKWLTTELAEAIKKPPLDAKVAMLKKVAEQDVEPDPDGSGSRIKDGVTPDRQISIHDPDMRHGRKSKSKRFNGFKRTVLMDLDIRGLVLGAHVAPANQPEGEAAKPLMLKAEAQGRTVTETHVDRAYVDAEPMEEGRKSGQLRVIAKAHPIQNRGLFTKEDFVVDLAAMTATCPKEITVPIKLNQVAEFPASACDECALRAECTVAKKGNGRSLRIHENEAFQQDLRKRQRTPEGRAELRLRVGVEHGLARIGQTQGVRARYRGLAKNQFDLDRHAMVSDCYVLDAMWREAA